MDMIPLTYTQSIEQESLLRQIEMVRVQLTSLVIPSAVDRGMRFDNLLTAIIHAYALEQTPSVYRNIEHTIVSKRSRTALYSQYKYYWNALCKIHESWVGTDAYMQNDSYADLFLEFREHIPSGDPTWSILRSHISKGIGYISSGNEHPVIQAAIMSALVFTSPLGASTRREAAMLIAYAVLASHGYACGGRADPLSEWVTQAESLQSALLSIDTDNNLNHWILFVSLALKKTLEDSIATFTSLPSAKAKKHTDRHILLTQRQLAILRLLDKPGSTVNNAILRRRFGISQLTASRDLSYLMSRGLLTAFGKSRSIVYLRTG